MSNKENGFLSHMADIGALAVVYGFVASIFSGFTGALKDARWRHRVPNHRFTADQKKFINDMWDKYG